MARRTREQIESAQERFSDNPFMDPISVDEVNIADDPNRTAQPSGRVKFPPDWTEEQKDAYFTRMRRTAARLAEKERKDGVPFEGETVLLRR